jgi:hypothetical protein
MHVEHGALWFRIFGYGLDIIDRRIHPPLFSCRNRIRCHHIGHLCISVLKPRKHPTVHYGRPPWMDKPAAPSKSGESK